MFQNIELNTDLSSRDILITKKYILTYNYQVRHEVDYVPVPRVSYDYVPEERTYMAGTTNNLALARSRVDYPYRNDPYINNPLLRSTSPGPYRTTGYGSSYYSPYK